MDKVTELRSALLYFVDEAIGYRHSLHFFHRWLETGEQSELEQLIIEVGREHFFDLWPIINSIKDPTNNEGFHKIEEIIRITGVCVPRMWTTSLDEVRLTPLPSAAFANADIHNRAYTIWQLNSWQVENKEKVENPLAVIGQAYQYLEESCTNFYKVFYLLEILFGLDTLFSCVIDPDIKLLGNAVGNYYPKQRDSINKLASSISNNLELNWIDALSRNQIKSKQWLLDKLVELNLVPPKRKITDSETTTMVVGGWVGMLAYLATMRGINLDSVINIDIDTSVHSASHELNADTHNNFKNSGADIREVGLAKYKKLLIVDTIVEHFEDHGDWVKTLPKGTTVVLQGNDMFNEPDHVNCHKTLEEFITSCGLNTILWAGELNLPKCTRYMAIGKLNATD